MSPNRCYSCPRSIQVLDDDAMWQFIVNGYITLKTDLPASVHESIYQQTEEVFAKEGNPGNNVLPRIPTLQKVFDDPVVRGALTSVLGPNYLMHSHRHPHINPPQSKGGGWHKDSYWGYNKVRYHRTRWAMIFYYPQDVTLDNGPTGVVPGTHYYETRVNDSDAAGIPVCGEAGTFTVVHFDLWHRAFPNQTTKNRYMMKFQFTRMEEPQSPAWNIGRTMQPPFENGSFPDTHRVIWTQMWQWFSGQETLEHTNGRRKRAGHEAILRLIQTLRDESEPVRLNAAYTLGTIGAPAVPALMETLRNEPELVRLDAAYALGVAGLPAVPALAEALHDADERVRGYAAYALGDMGPSALEGVPALATVAGDPSAWVRRHVIEALGTIARSADVAVPALIEALHDEDGQVRFNAAYALARFGPSAHAAVPALAEVLHDENRYVSGHAVAALERIGTPEAIQALLHLLRTSRWCPFTTKESTF